MEEIILTPSQFKKLIGKFNGYYVEDVAIKALQAIKMPQNNSNAKSYAEADKEWQTTVIGSRLEINALRKLIEFSEESVGTEFRSLEEALLSLYENALVSEDTFAKMLIIRKMVTGVILKPKTRKI